MNRTGSKILHGMLLATSAMVGSPVIVSTAAMANPAGGSVVSGSATITNPSATTTVVTQSSNKALINWNSFSIPTGSKVTFAQPNSNSLTVNRVIGPDSSTIDGQLLANGNVWLLNANGILFGKGSQVNVNTLLATTSELSDSAFRSGDYNFTASPNPNASVVNQGTIDAASGGSVVLSAPRVSNAGLIQADLGTVVLGGAQAFTVDMTGDNLLRYQITQGVTQAPKDANGSAASALVSNSGTIAANGGHVLMTARAAKSVEDNVINNTGMVEATSVSSHDGEIDLDAGPDGTVEDSGTLKATGSSAGETGGTVDVTGATVKIEDGAKINASGYSGGGTINIGGDAHGKGSLRHANRTIIGAATIVADATVKGNGGDVTVWSDGRTNFAGAISARGGAKGGNGGYVETSGRELSLTGSSVSTLAAKGDAGMWLIDPYAVEICANGCSPTGTTTALTTGNIETALGSSNVTIEALGGGANSTITLDTNSTLSYSNNTLALLAEGSILLKSSIVNTGTGALDLVAGWDGTTGVGGTPANGQSGNAVNIGTILSTAGAYGNNNANVTIGYTNSCGTLSVGGTGNTTVAAQDLFVGVAGNYTANFQLGYGASGGGNIAVALTGNLTLQSDNSGSVQIGNGVAGGNVTGSTTGNINITVGSSGTGEITTGGNGTIVLGNQNEGSTVTGNFMLLVDSQSGIDPTLLNATISNDINNGNVTIGVGTVYGHGNAITGLTVGDGSALDYDSSNALTLLATGSISVVNSVQNAGTGNITVIADWNGNTTVPAVLPLTTPAYANPEGGVTLQATTEDTKVSIGSYGGTTTIEGYNVDVSAENGMAQIGYAGAGGGNINVLATGGLTVDGTDNDAIIGNGKEGAGGVGTGDVTITVTDATTLTSGDGDVILGNGLTGSTGEGESGDLYFSTGTLSETEGSNPLEASMEDDIKGGNVSLYFTDQNYIFDDPNASDLGGLYDLTISASGYLKIEEPLQMPGNSTGSIILIAGGNLSLTGSGDVQSGNIQLIAATGNITQAHNVDLDGGNLYLTSSNGNITLLNQNDVDGTIDIFAPSGSVALGNKDDTNLGTVNVGGNLTVLSTGDLTATSSIQNAGSGNITLVAGWDGTTTAAGSLANPGVYGNPTEGEDEPYGDIYIGGGYASGSVAVGSKSGTTTIEGDSVYLQSYEGNTQIGYQGGGGTGNIKVLAASDVDLYAGSGYAQIGHGGSDATGAESGNITVTAGGDVNVDAGTIGGGDYAQIGHGGSGASGNNSGTITVNATGAINLTGGEGSGNYAQIGHGGTGSLGNDSGNISVVAATGNVTLTGTIYDDSDDSTSQSYAQIGDGGAFTGNATSAQSGNILVKATDGSVILTGATDEYEQDGYALIGGSGTATKTGNITVIAGTDVTLTGGASDDGGDGLGHSFAQIGDVNQGNITANISVTAGGNLTLTGGTGATGDDGDSAQIGNNDNSGDIVLGNVTANITGTTTLTASVASDDVFIGNVGSGSGGSLAGNVVLKSGGAVMLAATGNDTVAAIGDVGDANESVNGNVSVNTTGQALTLESNGSSSYAQIGDWTQSSSTGALSGNITVAAGAVGLNANGSSSSAQIGNGNYLGDETSGSITGNITVNATSVSLNGTAPSGGYEEARIGNLGGGIVTGDVAVTTTGDITVADSGFGAASIGDFSDPYSDSGTYQGEGSGTVTVTSGGNIFVTSQADGYSSIEIGGAANGAVNVTAHGNVTETASGGAGALIGSLEYENGGTNVSVTAQTGQVDIESTDVGSRAQVGNIEYLASGAVSGNVTVKAANASNGNIILSASGGDTDPVQIGNTGATGGTVSGNILLVAGNEVELNPTGNQTSIGNTGGSESGAVTIDAQKLDGNIAPSIADDLPGGNFTLALTGNSTVTIDSALDYDSAYNFSLSNGGDIVFDSSVQNAGSGNITITSGNNVTIGGGGATGNVAVGSAHGATTVHTGNLTVVADNGYAQLGYDGAANGSITVAATGNILVNATVANDAAQIGNGGGGITGAVGGNIVIGAANITVVANGTTTIANIGNMGGDGSTQSGNITVNATGALLIDAANLNPASNKTAANAQIGNLEIDTAGTPTQLGNASGNINVTAGSTTLDGDGQYAFSQIGNGNSFLYNNDVSGNITLATGDLSLSSTGADSGDFYGFARIGHRAKGNETANISVNATGNIIFTAGDYGNAIIGDGTTNGSSTGNVSVVTPDKLVMDSTGIQGQSRIGAGVGTGVTGNISVKAADIALDASAQSATSLISNFGGGAMTGNITVTATAGNVALDAAGQGSFAYIGLQGTDTTAAIDGNVNVTASGPASSGDGDIELGAGGVNSLAQIGNGQYEFASLTGDITLNAANAIVATASGSGAVVQIGNGGVGSVGNAAGNVTLDAAGLGNAVDITVSSNSAAVQIGNGGVQADGDDSGNVNITATHGSVLADTTGTDDDVQIGNGGDAFTGSAGGDVSVTAAHGNITGTVGAGDALQFGNGGIDSDESAAHGFSDTGDVSLSAVNIAFQTQGANASIQVGNGGYCAGSNGNAACGETSNVTTAGPVAFGGNISVTASKSLSMVTDAATDGIWIANGGDQSGAGLDVSGGAFSTTGDIAVDVGTDQQAGALTMTGGSSSGGNDVRIGNGGYDAGNAATADGGIVYSGNVTVDVRGGTDDNGAATLFADSSGSFVQIGSDNASVGTVSGTVTTDVDGVLSTGDSGGAVLIGNVVPVGATGGGDVFITAQSIDGIAGSVAYDIAHGNVTVTSLGTDPLTLDTAVSYDSGYNLSLNANGDVVVDSSVQNAGSGDITLTSPGNVTIGGSGASGNVAFGSAGGVTTISIDGNLTVAADNGYAQIGYHGAGSGFIDVDVMNGITLTGGSSSALEAQIGDGATFAPSGGDVYLYADSIAATGSAGIAGDAADVQILGGGAIGSASDPLDVAVDELAVQTDNANAYLSAPQGISVGVTGSALDLDAAASGIDLGSGTLQLAAAGNITQNAAINAGGVAVSTANGNIALTDAGNTFSTATLSANGDASLTDSEALSITGASVGGNLTLMSGGSITQTGAITADGLSASTADGSIALTNAGNAFGTASLNASGDASLTDSAALSVAGATVGGNLTLTGGGDIGQTGAISADGITVAAANGSIALTNADNTFATASLSASGDAALTDASALVVDGATVGGNLTLASAGSITQTGAITAKGLSASTTGGDIDLDDSANAFDTAALASSGNTTLYDSANLTVTGANSDGDLTLGTGGNLTFVSSVQLASGSLRATAKGNVVIGGSDAKDNVAIGSRTGSIDITGADILLQAVNGYAQIGYHGGGNGDITVNASGAIKLSGGATQGLYAQIGDGGYQVSGSNSGAVKVTAAGNVTLNAGAGAEAYAQIGNGGALSNKDSAGYTDTGLITVSGENVTLGAGNGDGSYAQIGDGGYESGQSLNGTATVGSDVTVDAVNDVVLTGNGADAYAQIGNGGGFINDQAADGSGGTIAGNITVAVSDPQPPGGAISLKAGGGADSYAQIGNGGDGENTPASGNVNFDVSGNVVLDDLTLVGSDTGTDAYAQIGNGDAAKTGTANVSGNITVSKGTTFNITPGTAPGTSADIQNGTGKGSVSGSVDGYTSPTSGNTAPVSDPTTAGSVSSIVQNPVTPTSFTITQVEVTPEVTNESGTEELASVETTPSPLAKMSGGDEDTGGETASDSVAGSVGTSLSGGKTYTATKTLIPGVLKEVVTLTPRTPHGVPPADEDYSSWGNEALWRW